MSTITVETTAVTSNPCPHPLDALVARGFVHDSDGRRAFIVCTNCGAPQYNEIEYTVLNGRVYSLIY